MLSGPAYSSWKMVTKHPVKIEGTITEKSLAQFEVQNDGSERCPSGSEVGQAGERNICGALHSCNVSRLQKSWSELTNQFLRYCMHNIEEGGSSQVFSKTWIEARMRKYIHLGPCVGSVWANSKNLKWFVSVVVEIELARVGAPKHAKCVFICVGPCFMQTAIVNTGCRRFHHASTKSSSFKGYNVVEAERSFVQALL